MAYDDSSSRRNTPVPILVIEDNQDHQLLIAHFLEISVAQVKPFIVDSAEQALAFLSQAVAESDRFPRLVVLDLYLPEATQGWQLLTKLRSCYPRLPIVMLTSHPEVDIISKAYELGVCSFMEKPTGGESWADCFQAFAQFWLTLLA